MDLAEFQEPDEARPAKRVRLEAPLAVTEELQEEIEDVDDWDDIYGVAGGSPAESRPVAEAIDALDAVQQLEGHVSNADVLDVAIQDSTPIRNEAPTFEDAIDEANSDGEVNGGKAVGEAGDGSGLALEEVQVTLEDGSQTSKVVVADDMGNGSTRPDDGIQSKEPDLEKKAHGNHPELTDTLKRASPVDERVMDVLEGAATITEIPGDTAKATSKPTEDTEFLEAAAAQKDNEAAEWQFDSSDAESSDSSSDSSSDEESDEAGSGSEDGYEMLDPAAAAKILMSGDGDDDEGRSKDKAGGDRQPRTANEKKEEVVPKPDVVITPEMKITYLGMVDRIVDNQLLIKAVTPGEYQVLEYGSVLCNEERQVVGAVADTFGRVQEPLYSVAFTNAKEIEDVGYEHGTKIFYVDGHSSFVFTQPLKNLKGTDASNIHDEEVGEDELEFSDDEKEAEYKRMKKVAKREGRGGLSRGAFMEERADMERRPFANGSDAPQQQYGGGISYDDVDAQEEFYKPLKRPDNLSQLMAGGGPPRPQHGHSDRGRGRGRGDRGRGRGDRGRGRGGSENRHQRGGREGSEHRHQRSGRGGYNQDRGMQGQQNGHRGNAHSFPDRHNDYRNRSSPTQQHSPPSRSSAQQRSPPSQAQHGSYQPYPSPQASSPQSYQFNGFTFQYGNPPPQPPSLQVQTGRYNQQPPPQSAHSPNSAFPAGAYVNPAFFQGQQPWAHSPQQQQSPAYAGWPQQPQQNAQSSYGAYTSPGANYGSMTSQQQPRPAPNNNLADILKQLGGPRN